MSTDSPTDKARRYVEQHTADHQAGHQYTNGPVITISRETGAGANFVCDELIAMYEQDYPPGNCPWAAFDKNLIDKVMADHAMPQKLKSYLGEEKNPVMKTVMNELLGIHPPMMKLFHDTSETVLHLARIGYCIIVGRGANLITVSNRRAVHIRLIASESHRVKNMQTHYQMDFKTAVEFVKQEDIKRRKYVQTYFGKNPDEPHLYHLILNTGLMSFREAALLIKHFAEGKLKESAVHHY